jgi:hypothetical protein
MPSRARFKCWGLVSVAVSASGVFAACSNRSSDESFEPGLPPDSIVAAFGGQTGSDQLDEAPRGGPTADIPPDQEIPLGFSGNELAAVFARDVVVHVSNATYRTTLELIDVEEVKYVTIEEGSDNDIAPGNYVTLQGTLHLAMSAGSFDFLMPATVVARALNDVVALGYQPEGDLGVLASELGGDETLRLTIAIRNEQLDGWLAAWDIDADSVRAFGKVARPF